MTTSSIKENFAGENNSQAMPPPRYMPLKYGIMAAFLLMVMPVLIAMSVFNYFDVRNDMRTAYSLLQQQTENSIIKAIEMVDGGHRILENFLDQKMKEVFKDFIAAYEETGRDPAKMDLEALKQEFGGKMDLYIINKEGIVQYTTYAKDQNLDFKQWPDHYASLVNILQNDEFVSGGLTTEARTGNLRKFAYMPSPDNRYLLELGLISDEFKELMGDLELLKIANHLKTLNPSLESVKIFSRNGHLLGDPNYEVPSNTKKLITQAYQTKDSLTVHDLEQDKNIHYLFVELKGSNALVDRSKVVELVYNTKLIDDSLARKTEAHLFISILAIALIILGTFVLAAWITRPIKQIVDGVNVIAKGNLDYPIDHVTARNELKILKQSIIIMVENMRNYINHIEKQNVELRELDRLKDDFLSNTSHELRTPINGIIGIADSMIAGASGQLPAKAEENLSMIVLSGRRLSNLVNDILDFSKLKHKNLMLQLKPTEIKVITDIVVTLSRPLVGRKKLEIINELPDEPPVEADENRLQQILYNLIGNAIKFTDVGEVRISGEIKDSTFLVKITDTGIGIAQEKIDRVFESFEQGDGSTARQYGGTGLGLSITKQLVELHGGQIWIESKVGQGTEVTFSLPISEAPAENQSGEFSHTLSLTQNLAALNLQREEGEEGEEGEEKDTTSLTDSGARDGPTVLIVDDEPINLQVLENLLTLEDFSVVRANNGFEALEAVNSGLPISMVLLDLMMPKMSGFEVCRILREKHSPSKLPIIMLTAKNQVSDLVEGLMAGANDYVTKPFNKNELNARIKTHIQLARITIAYSYFVPHEFLRLLEKESIIDVRLGDHVQKHMTVLFVDIRSFTTLSEKMTPKENFDFINEYLGRMSPVIRRYNGFIDKYIGDAIMALFPGQPEDAVRAAIDIHRQLVEFNRERAEKGVPPVGIGIGLHTGNLMLGTIGEEQRMEGTVISDAVNLASRLEGLTKVYGASPVISEQTLQGLGDAEGYAFRFLDKVRVKGKKEPVHIYEVMNSETDAEALKLKLANLPDFERAIEYYYQRRFQEAAEIFARLVKQQASDKTSALYLERCNQYIHHQPPKDWDGVEALTQK